MLFSKFALRMWLPLTVCPYRRGHADVNRERRSNHVTDFFSLKTLTECTACTPPSRPPDAWTRDVAALSARGVARAHHGRTSSPWRERAPRAPRETAARRRIRGAVPNARVLPHAGEGEPGVTSAGDGTARRRRRQTRRANTVAREERGPSRRSVAVARPRRVSECAGARDGAGDENKTRHHSPRKKKNPPPRLPRSLGGRIEPPTRSPATVPPPRTTTRAQSRPRR